MSDKNEMWRGAQLENPYQEAAETKAERIVERMVSSEAIRTIDGLLEEVESMSISRRFSSTKKAWEAAGGPPRGFNLSLQGLTEAEYKRAQLKRDLQTLKTEIIQLIDRARTAVMDM